MSIHDDDDGDRSWAVNRREALALAGGTAGVLALGGAGLHFTSPKFLRDINKDTFESRALGLRNNLEAAEGEFDNLEERQEEEGYSTDISDYESPNGVKISDNFRLAVPQDMRDPEMEVEQGGDSFEFEYQDGTAQAGSSLDDVKGLLDTDDNGTGEIPLSGDAEDEIEQLLNEFNDVALYTKNEPTNDQPILGESQIQELREEKETLDNLVNSYVEFLGDGEQSPDEILEGTVDMIDQLGEAERDRYIEILGSNITGEDYDEGPRFLVGEDQAILEGNGEYSDRGLEETKDRAEQLVTEATRSAAMTAVMRDTIDYALQAATDQQDTYEDGRWDENAEPSDGSAEDIGSSNYPDECNQGFRSETSEVAEEYGGNPSYNVNGQDLEIYVEGDLKETLEGLC